MIRAGDFLRRARELAAIDFADLTRGRSLIVIAPHPDDESLGCGGLIATACEHGSAVRIVLLSDGTGSHPSSRRYPPKRLRALREAELVEAAAILGVPAQHITCLRLPDRRVPQSGSEFERAVAAVQKAAGEIDAGSVFVTWRHDPHCDHQAAAAIARNAVAALAAVRLYAYPIWGWNLPEATLLDEPEPGGGRLDIRRYLPRKRLAIQAHRSQTTSLIDDDERGFRLDPAVLVHFDLDHEVFLECVP